MKKFIISLFALVMLSLPAYALEATVAQFDVYVGGTKIEHKNTLYPLLTYKDVTYFPMTYDYVRLLGLTSSWENGEFHLSYCPTTTAYTYSTEYLPEVKTIQAELDSHPVYVNGKLLDNSQEEYPVFNARGITYFPLTWRFATEEFGMSIAWDDCLIINSLTNISNIGFTDVKDGKAYFGNSFYQAELTENRDLSYTLIGDKNFVLDASDNTVSAYDGTLPYAEFGSDISERLSISGNDLQYDGVVIADVTDYVAAEKERENPLGINIYGIEYDLGGGKSIVSVSLTYKTEFAQPHAIGLKTFCFISDSGNFVPLDINEDKFFHSVEHINGNSYVCLIDYSQLLYTTYLLTDGNTLVPVTDAAHSNIELIGQIDGKPVVKATRKSEYEDVSAINDGYFTIEADGSFNKIYPYTHTDGAAVVNNRLYLLIWRNNTIVDTSTGEEIRIYI